VDTSTHHLSAFGHHVTIGTGFPIYEGGEEGLLPSVNILRFHRSTLASTIQTTFSKVSTDLIPAAPLWLRDINSPENLPLQSPDIRKVPSGKVEVAIVEEQERVRDQE
jgi:hypothetical protein